MGTQQCMYSSGALAKQKNCVVKFSQKVPKTGPFNLFFQRLARSANFLVNRVFILVIWECSENYFYRPSKVLSASPRENLRSAPALLHDLFFVRTERTH